MRISQWYKNTLIFIPLIFSLNFFNPLLFLKTLLGFLSLSLISSSYYIINDLKDYKKDKFHSEKSQRPIASGRIPKPIAFLISIILFIDSLLLAYALSTGFLVAAIILFISSQIYIFYLRDIAFFDIISISINFIIRTLAGVPLIKAPAPNTLVLSAFFLSIFLVSGKRISESYLKNLEKYRPSLDKQHKDTLTLMATASVTSTILFFAIYSLETNPFLLITLPISFYLVLLYFNNVYHNPEKIRNPEKFILDPKIIISLAVWGIILLFSLYFPL